MAGTTSPRTSQEADLKFGEIVWQGQLTAGSTYARTRRWCSWLKDAAASPGLYMGRIAHSCAEPLPRWWPPARPMPEWLPCEVDDYMHGIGQTLLAWA